MKAKKRPQIEAKAYHNCKKCIFNDYEKCGKMLCILPYCVNENVRRVMDGKPKSKDL